MTASWAGQPQRLRTAFFPSRRTVSCSIGGFLRVSCMPALEHPVFGIHYDLLQPCIGCNQSFERSCFKRLIRCIHQLHQLSTSFRNHLKFLSRFKTHRSQVRARQLHAFCDVRFKVIREVQRTHFRRTRSKPIDEKEVLEGTLLNDGAGNDADLIRSKNPCLLAELSIQLSRRATSFTSSQFHNISLDKL